MSVRKTTIVSKPKPQLMCATYTLEQQDRDLELLEGFNRAWAAMGLGEADLFDVEEPTEDSIEEEEND